MFCKKYFIFVYFMYSYVMKFVCILLQLERLQAENAAEWGKRERLETEKLTLERDNKKLRAELRDLQERIEKKGRPLSNSDTEMRHLQQELADKTKVCITYAGI